MDEVRVCLFLWHKAATKFYLFLNLKTKSIIFVRLIDLLDVWIHSFISCYNLYFYRLCVNVMETVIFLRGLMRLNQPMQKNNVFQVEILQFCVCYANITPTSSLIYSKQWVSIFSRCPIFKHVPFLKIFEIKLSYFQHMFLIISSNRISSLLIKLYFFFF